MSKAVSLAGPIDERLASVAGRAAEAGTDVAAGLALATDLAGWIPQPGGGRTALRFEVLASLAAGDVTAARVAEPHLDAVAILAEAAADGQPLPDLPADATWGVFAAEGPGTRLQAEQRNGGWRLDGRKPWCSLAGTVTAGLVTAHTPDGRRLFAVDLRQPGISVVPGGWHARGLADVPSGPVDFDDVTADPVGPAGWYLQRPGFWWGGIGVAAIWWGGTVGLARALYERCHRTPDQPILVLHLGVVDAAVSAARAVLAQAAVDVDRSAGVDGRLLASRVRGIVHDAAELVLLRVGHALGPAPLALDAAHARRVADLGLYLRQHHAERDQAETGRYLAEADGPPW